MGKTIVIVVATVVFTILGMLTGLVIVLNLPRELHDPEGIIRIMSVLAPTAGGLIAGVIVGVIAVSLGGSGSK